MNIDEFTLEYGKLKFWFVSYNNYCFKLKSINTECDQIYILVGGLINIRDMYIEFNKEYPLKDFNILCALVRKTDGEIIHVNNVIDAADYLK